VNKISSLGDKDIRTHPKYGGVKNIDNVYNQALQILRYDSRVLDEAAHCPGTPTPLTRKLTQIAFEVH
jgi:hypothetical protein